MSNIIDKLNGYFLVVETAMLHTSACIGYKNEVKAGFNFDGQTRHASGLLQGVSDMFTQLHIAAKDLSAVCISIGPGSYTGLRIGMASMKGLVYAGNIPFYGFSTLQAVALSAALKYNHQQKVLAMMDARRQNVFAGMFRLNGDVLWNNKFINLEELNISDFLEDQNQLLITGNNLPEFSKYISSQGVKTEAVNPDISSYVSLIFDSKIDLRKLDPLSAEPLYLKSPYITRPGLKKA